MIYRTVMYRWGILFFVAISVLSFFIGNVQAEKELRYHVYMFKDIPVMDGKVDDDPAWAGIPAGTGFHVLGGRTPVEKQTVFRVGFTSDSLYVSFVCGETDMAGLVGSSKDNNPANWGDDGVEFFILPWNIGNVFQVIVNAAGGRTNYQAGVNDPGIPGVAPLSWSRAAAFKGKDFYSVEIEIPFKELSRVPGDGEVWNGNFCRNINLGKKGSHYSWAHTVQRYCEPDRFAQMVFHHGNPPTGKNEVIDALASGHDDTELHLIVGLTFDEGQGEVAHGQSAIINDGMIFGASWVPGLSGHALKFEKEGDRVEVPDSESLRHITTALTLEATAYFDLKALSGTTGALISTAAMKSGFGYGYYLNYVDSGRSSRCISFGLAQNWGTRIWLEQSNAITTNGWHHVIATYDANLSDGKRGKIYVDGQLTGSFDQAITGINPSMLPMTIGSSQVTADKKTMGCTFRGMIDSVKVWDKALSPEEIEKLYGAQWVKSKLISPAPSETVKDGSPRFQWTPVTDGTGYVFELANVPDFSAGAMIKKPLATPEFSVTKALSPGVYYWRVWSTDKTGKPTAACEPRAVIIPFPAEFETADTTPPAVTDVKPASDTTTDNASSKISVRWSDNQGIDVKSAQLLLDGKDVTAMAAITDKGADFTPETPMAKGVHTIEVLVKDTSGNSANRVRQHFSVDEPFTTVVKVGPDLVTYINDEPFFPVMFYGGGVSEENRARAGFNSVYGGAALADEVEGKTPNPWFRSLNETGLKFFGSFDTLMSREGGPDYDGFTKSVPFYDKNVEFLAYSLDEPNSHPEGIEQATKMYEIILANGHRRPFLCILNSPGAAGLFGNVGDGVLVDVYPIPDQSLVHVAKYVENAYKMLDYKKPVWLCQQAFNWDLFVKYNHGLPEGKTKQDVLKSLLDSGFIFRPTPAEMRAMTYLALAHDAKGILWWSASWGYERLASIQDFPKDYEAFQNLVGEIHYLSSMLVAPESPVQVRVEPEGLGLHMKVKSFDSRIYVIVVNPNQNLPMAPVFTLPAGKWKKVDVLFENRTFNLKNPTFRDMFEPAGVHVYRIE